MVVVVDLSLFLFVVGFGVWVIFFVVCVLVDCCEFWCFRLGFCVVFFGFVGVGFVLLVIYFWVVVWIVYSVVVGGFFFLVLLVWCCK